MPIVAVNDVRMLVALQHELQRRPAEKREALVVIGMAVKYVTVKKILVRMRLDEKAFPTMHEPKINAAMNRVMIPGNPEVFGIITLQ